MTAVSAGSHPGATGWGDAVVDGSFRREFLLVAVVMSEISKIERFNEAVKSCVMLELSFQVGTPSGETVGLLRGHRNPSTARSSDRL